MKRSLVSSSPRWLATLCLLLAIFVPVQSAQAYHDEKPSLEESAYQLRSKEWLLGPLELGVGLWRFQISTHTMPWLIGAALGKVTPNLSVDMLLLEHKQWTLSAQTSFLYVNSNKLSDDVNVVHLFMLPVGLALSYRINDAHTVSTRFRYLRVLTRSDAGEADLTVEGGALADNAQLHASWEWRLSRVSALLVYLRYLPYQGDPVLKSTVAVDEYTTAEVDATIDAEDMQHAVAGGVAGVFSWKYFNLRAGLTYGSLFLEGSGLVLPLKYPYPEFSLYWRL